MRVMVATLADAANVCMPNKLNILGAFSTVYARSLPATIPSMALVLRMEIEFSDTNREHTITVSMRDDDGNEGGRGDIKFFAPASVAGELVHMNQIMNFAAVTFGRAGQYDFQISWDGKLVHQVPLLVKVAPPAAKVER